MCEPCRALPRPRGYQTSHRTLACRRLGASCWAVDTGLCRCNRAAHLRMTARCLMPPVAAAGIEDRNRCEAVHRQRHNFAVTCADRLDSTKPESGPAARRFQQEVLASPDLRWSERRSQPTPFPRIGAPQERPVHSTVTLLARLRGLWCAPGAPRLHIASRCERTPNRGTWRACGAQAAAQPAKPVTRP